MNDTEKLNLMADLVHKAKVTGNGMYLDEALKLIEKRYWLHITLNKNAMVENIGKNPTIKIMMSTDKTYLDQMARLLIDKNPHVIGWSIEPAV